MRCYSTVWPVWKQHLILTHEPSAHNNSNVTAYIGLESFLSWLVLTFMMYLHIVNGDVDMQAVKTLSSQFLYWRCFCLIFILRKNNYIIMCVCMRTHMSIHPFVRQTTSSFTVNLCHPLTMKVQNLSWYKRHTGYDMKRHKLVVNFIKNYLIWMLILLLHEIYFDNCLMIFGLGTFCNDLLVIFMLLCSAVWWGDILTYFEEKTSTQYFSKLHQWLWCLQIAEDSLFSDLSFLLMSLNMTFHWFKYFIVHLRNMLSLFIQCNISVLNDITRVLA